MGCGSCGTGSSCSTKGCGGGCKSGGCNKLNTFDWFAGMQQPTQSESDNIYEVRFKNTRKEFFRNVNALPLITGDFVVVESDRGFDVGQISLGGILARLQMRKRKVRADNDRMRKIYRRATREDVEKLQKTREREQDALVRTREIIRELDLEMKLSDVEFQGDATKAIFYYIADTRVDFRELIKRLANEFKVRVEMKQIGLRHESGLVGGIGSCGRELCCATWLTDFKTVSTRTLNSLARRLISSRKSTRVSAM
jgi:cell fate regulator YaaT (PSP1 superfamily)